MQLKIIHSVVCSYYGLSKIEIFDKTRNKDVIPVRQMFHYIAKKHTSLSLNKIGGYYSYITGNTWDHASVLHSKKVVEGLNKVDKKTISDIKSIELILKAIEEVAEKKLPTIKEGIIKIVLNNDNAEDLLKEINTYTGNVLKTNKEDK